MTTLSRCSIVVFSLLFIIVLGVYLAYKYGYNILGNFYDKSFKETCSSQTYRPVNIPSAIPKFVFDRELARNLMNFSYNVSISNCPNMGQLPIPSGFDVVREIYGKSNNIERRFAFLLFSTVNRVGLLVFTGTMFLDQWREDINIGQTPVQEGEMNNWFSGMRIHSGFFRIYLSLRSSLISNLVSLFGTTPHDRLGILYITGHSLGGALASVATLDLAKKYPLVTYTFASPRVFDIPTAIFLNKTVTIYRIFNTEDLIPDVPLSNLFSDHYEHVGSNIPFTLNLGTDRANHGNAYLQF